MANVTESKELTGKEDVGKDKRAFLLFYRYLNNIGNAKGNPLERMFWFRGALGDARIRARKHCDVMNYRYINCTPFIIDLDEVEKLRLQNKDSEDE